MGKNCEARSTTCKFQEKTPPLISCKELFFCFQVRHPGVTAMMQRDFILMRRAAYICSKLPGLKDLRLEESVQQFGGPLKEQLDLSSEARALARFNDNFKWWKNIKFPVPVYPLVAPDVLIETFQPGRLISRYACNMKN